MPIQGKTSPSARIGGDCGESALVSLVLSGDSALYGTGAWASEPLIIYDLVRSVGVADYTRFGLRTWKSLVSYPARVEARACARAISVPQSTPASLAPVICMALC